MNKNNAIILGSLILATIFGICGQGLAYFSNEIFAKIHPIYYLTVFTIISVFLYLSSFVLIYLQYRKQRIEKDKLESYFFVLGFICFLTSCWSFLFWLCGGDSI